MDSEKLYRVQEEDLSKLEELLCRSFAADPLYVELIPDEEVRKRLMPELFQCDLTEFYETCEIFADSKDLNGILVVSDETEPYHLLHRYFTEVQATLRTEGYLIREDHSLKTFFNFVLGRDYLNSSWTDQLHQVLVRRHDRRFHAFFERRLRVGNNQVVGLMAFHLQMIKLSRPSGLYGRGTDFLI